MGQRSRISVRDAQGMAVKYGGPDLTFWKPNGTGGWDVWADDIRLSKSPGTEEHQTTFSQGDTIYLDVAPWNKGSIPIPSSWRMEVYVDGTMVAERLQSAGTGGNSAGILSDISLGSYASGTHTIRVVLDSRNEVGEADEGTASNERTRTFQVAAAVPTVITSSASNVTSNSATVGGVVTGAGGSAVTERGVVYATVQNPTTATGTKRTSGSGTGSFTGSLTGLSPNTTYYARAYAINSAGTAYGTQISFNTSSGPGVQGYEWSNFAGRPLYHGGEDGTGSAARFYQVNGCALDGSGNLYVADTLNHTIRKVTSSGVVTTLAGSALSSGSADGTGSAARFSSPMDVAVDSGGNLYVADWDNDTIRKVTPAGVVTTLAGSATNSGSADGTGSTARFSGPMGVAVDGSGNLYVADEGNGKIRKVTPSGMVTTFASIGGYPTGVAVDGSGNVYVADGTNNTIRKVTPAGVVTTLAGSTGNGGSADGTGSAARFDGPWDLAIDGAGSVYVADRWNNTIRKVTPAGVVTTLGGSAGNEGSADGTGSAARFYGPSGVAVDNGGNVYVADTSNHRISKGVPPDLPGVTIRDAVDAPSLSWSTGGAADWTGQSAVTMDGVDAARSGSIADNTESWMETTVTGPGTIDFWWKVSSESGWDWLEFVADLQRLPQRISGEQDWQKVTHSLGSGVQVLRWRYIKDGSVSSGADAGYVDQVVFTPTSQVTVTTSAASNVTSSSATVGGSVSGGGTVSERGVVYATVQGPTVATGIKSKAGSGTGNFASSLTGLGPDTTYYARAYAVTGEGIAYGAQASFRTQPSTLTLALDGAGLAWATGGVASWNAQPETTWDGHLAVGSGVIGDGDQSWVETTVVGPGTLTFWWKVSSEFGYDFFRFLCSEAEQFAISGEVGWEQRIVAIPTGVNTLRWVYEKDDSVASGEDRAWLDQVHFVPASSPAPALTVVQRPRPFPATAVGKRSRTQALRIANAGGSPLSGIRVSASGKAKRDFILKQPAGTSLVPGAMTTFKVTFKPRAKGSRKATLEVRSSAPMAKAPLSGKGKTMQPR